MKPARLATGLVVLALTTAAAAAQGRDQIRIVGSSTVFPFSTDVAEQFGRSTDFQTPVVESTGSGGGLKLFCAGVGIDTPDIINASRRMKAREFQRCADNGVTEVTEAVIGFDGIVVANAIDAPQFELTRAQLVIALASKGPNPAKWSDVDPSLPEIAIEVLGPPPSSGTRDGFMELVMDKGCEETDLVACDGVSLREDGAWVDSGENDNLIVSKLEANPDALGIFGFSFLDQNADALQGAVIDGVDPTFENIASGDYPVLRSLYFYIKNAHVGAVPGIADYANAFMPETAVGADGYLIDRGLIPLPEADLQTYRGNFSGLKPLTAADFN